MRTVDWAIARGIETATFHILTPYPGTALWRKLNEQDRITTTDWDLYDTRHCVYQPFNMTATQLEAGYWKAYEQFYSWSSIWDSARLQQVGGLNRAGRFVVPAFSRCNRWQAT